MYISPCCCSIAVGNRLFLQLLFVSTLDYLDRQPLLAEHLINHYAQADWLASLTTRRGELFHLKGLKGSLGAIWMAAAHRKAEAPQFCIAADAEEAAYLYSDLCHLVNRNVVLLYGAGHVQPGTQEDVTYSADDLMRAEVLERLRRTDGKPPIIITYPTALHKRVIGPEVFQKHTWTVSVGDDLTTGGVAEWLTERGFERTDFVYEAGQFSIRGGIIDVFGYAHQLPFRIELSGNTVESIRVFDTEDQCSLESVSQMVITPSLTALERTQGWQSILDYLPNSATVWIKDHGLVLDTLTQEKGDTVEGDRECIETPESWREALARLTCVHFGAYSGKDMAMVIACDVAGVSSFHQRFDLLAADLQANEEVGIKNIITATSASQFDAVRTLLDEQDVRLSFTPLLLGLHAGFVDRQWGVACYPDHTLFDRYYRYESPKRYSATKAVTLRELRALNTGDYVVHADYGIGRFAGLSSSVVGGKEQERIRLLYKDDDLVYVSLQSLHKISKYAGKEGAIPSMTKLGSSAWEQKKRLVKRRVKDIAKELIQLYAQRKEAPGFAFDKDGFAQAHLESSFIYEDTPDQSTATAAVKKDMEASHPMDRLICGDVGFGKTEVAIRAAFKATQAGKQVAVLVPTTILALQHYNSFRSRLAGQGICVDNISRFKTAKEIRSTLAAVSDGSVQVLIGTHRILNKDIQFKDLGLLIIDEEQKFGVKAKDKLKELRLNVDVLTLTATPIPRTLHFSLMGARDLSIIATPPANRQPVVTTIHPFDASIIKAGIEYELQRGGQVFFVHNRVANIEATASMIHKLVPESRVGVAHGQMEGKQLEQRMVQFMEGKYDVLVATSIIESGLDIPNANTIFINNSHLFGLSDLHQMRGRVGRSNKKSFCYLLAPPLSTLTNEARRRLSALEEFSELGDGFKVAMRDLDIRGAGDLLGAEQSGFIADVGFETYCQILDDAVKELKTGEFEGLFANMPGGKRDDYVMPDCALETDWEGLIPVTYVGSSAERISLYARLDACKDKVSLEAFAGELKDRFGPIPEALQTLMELVEIRWAAQRLGFCKLRIKNGAMRCYLTQEMQGSTDLLERLLAYVQRYPRRCRMKEVKDMLMLAVEDVSDMDSVLAVLEAI